LFSCAEFGEGNGGIVLNISQGGLALQSVAELVDEESLDIRCQLSQLPNWIVAKGRLAWRSGSKNMAGVEFIDLPDESRRQIQTCISLTSDASRFNEETAPLDEIGQAAGATAFPEPASANPLPKSRIVDLFAGNKSQHPIAGLPLPSAGGEVITGFRQVCLVVVFVLFLACFFLLGHQMREFRNAQKGGEIKVQPRPPVVAPQPSASPSLNP